MTAPQEIRVRLRDGAELWAATAGSGPPVVFFHGGPGLWDYLGSLADLLADSCSVVRFDQRGCGRSTGQGPFTISQAIDDVEQMRMALGIGRWSVLGHSWGAELALRYAAAHPDHTASVVYIAGIGADDSYAEEYAAERDARLGPDLRRWRALAARSRTAEEEHEWCLLQWRPDFSPSGTPRDRAAELWTTRPPGAVFNSLAQRELWADRATRNLLTVATDVAAHTTMIFGADDPRPWSAAQPVFAALSDVRRLVVADAGHAPWVEQPDVVRSAVLNALSSGRRL